MLLSAAEQLGISIPTLCYLKGYPHFTSCMVCMVQDMKSGKMLASCSVPIAEGMIIETDNEEVRQIRREALELLMSDHVGDCIAPCQRTCPAHMNIPQMNMFIEAGRTKEALITVKDHIALPAILGRICPAPCENNCRRSNLDGSISICALKSYVAEEDLRSSVPYLPERKPSSGKQVAIIGSGPTGLAAAYYLPQYGHACTIFDNRPEPGGMLRYGVPEEELPRDILDAEIDVIKNLGVKFEMNKDVGKDPTFPELKKSFAAIVLATGQLSPDEMKDFEVETTGKSVRVDNATFATNVKGVFAGGGVVKPGKMAVRSVGHGRSIAISVDRFLQGQDAPVSSDRSQSRIGKFRDGELASFITSMDDLKKSLLPEDVAKEQIGEKKFGISDSEAIGESSKCIQCGCASFHGCKLRIYTEQYNANAQRFKGERRKDVERIYDHPFVVYEPGKCIQCGLCVRITEESSERLGLTFIGRGFDVRVDPSLNGNMKDALEKTAADCIVACPSGALIHKDQLCYK